MKWRLMGCLLAVPFVVGCLNRVAPEVGNDETPRSLQDDRLVINNDRADLDTRVEIMSKLLFVQAKETPGREFAPSQKTTGTKLTQVGRINSPIVNGERVQANDVDISGKTAVIAYNYAGDEFAGAVQVVDFTNPKRPRLLSEVVYRDADITAVMIHGQDVYVGMGSLDPALETPALLEEFRLEENGLQRTGRWIDLPSWVVTDLGMQGAHVLASVGAAQGGVALVNRTFDEFRLDAFHAEVDVRGIDFPNDVSLAAVCGTNPRMATMSVPDMAAEGSYEVDGYNNTAAKGTIEVHTGLCYLGAGDGGFQVLRPDGSLLAKLAHEDFSDVRPEEMVTNAVSVQGGLAYVAAGALGVQVVKLAGARGWAEGGGPDADGLEVLGELEFGDGMSSNMVKAKNNTMVVAAGVGGVKLVTMSGSD